MDHILFSLFISDLVFFIQQSSLSNYIDALLCTDIKIVENWLFENYIVLNPEKCVCVCVYVYVFMCIGKNVTDSELFNFNDQILRNCREVDILGIILDRNSNFKSHTKKLCRKVN